MRRTNTLRANRQLSEGLLVRRLGFSPEQMKQYRQSRLHFRQQVKPHEDSLRTLRTGMLDRVKDSLVTDDELTRMADAMYNQNRQITRIRFRHWQQVRSLCLPDQQATFDQLIRQIGQGMNNPGLRGRVQQRMSEKER
ncbi:hypothetical protein [Fibrella forsythiae]|uniref:Periplasmic heavy metal sensor n=1 Tax=Fibrella forsythiae TaxID=2817061 RepID=A0ABS3JAL8_9BACT|nr:hypothetical protein [Fibrella forsythiae]MBO0947043.1 hypothetical protein [Fibrella forsythiae]